MTTVAGVRELRSPSPANVANVVTTNPLASDAPIGDEEILYRAVANEARYFPVDAEGNTRISSTAFNDAGRRPSVDRAALCPGGPEETRARFRAGSGVLSLVTTVAVARECSCP